MNWNVIYTKSRSEKAVAEKLELAGFEVYCPLLKTKKLWSDRWKWVEEPLFRSYCIVKSDEASREKILSIPGVVRFVFHCGKPAVIRDQEIVALQSWLGTYEHESLSAENLNPQDRIRIKSGALLEKEATIIQSKGHYAVLYLEDIGMQVTVDLRKNLIEKV